MSVYSMMRRLPPNLASSFRSPSIWTPGPSSSPLLSRSLSSSPSLFAQHHFDTHQFVRRLEHEGLSKKQAEGVMEAIESVIDESVQTMSGGFVTKAAQEKVRRIQYPIAHSY